MKKIFLSGLAVIVVLAFSACGNGSDVNSSTKTNSLESTTTSTSSKNSRINFDSSEKSSKTYKEHVQDLWDKTKKLWTEDSKKKYSDEEYLKLGKEIDEAWVNIQMHTSIATYGHNDQDTSDSILGSMVGEILLDTDRIYGQRSLGDTKEEKEKRRNTAIENLDETIKGYDDILAKLTIK